MKKAFTLLAIALFPLFLSAQKNFNRFSAGFGGGITRNQGDLNNPSGKSLIIGLVDYHFNPYINAGVEFQSGKISGQENLISNRFYQNHFKTAVFTTKIHAGYFIKNREIATGYAAILNNTLKGIYAGAGIGFIVNNQKKIFRQDGNFSTSGADKTTDAVIPVTIGIDNSAFNSKFITGIGYQAHFAMGDQIDGYYSRGSNKDFYSTLVLSFKVRFGPSGIF